jgi:hypothetical protein
VLHGCPEFGMNRNWCAENFHLAQYETLICLLHLECRWSALSRWVHCSKYEVSHYINDLFYPGTCHCLGPSLQYTIEAYLWNCEDTRNVFFRTAFSLESTCLIRKRNKYSIIIHVSILCWSISGELYLIMQYIFPTLFFLQNQRSYQ